MNLVVLTNGNGPIALIERGTYLEKTDNSKKDVGIIDKLYSCDLDRDLQIKLVRCWPCLMKCLIWPFLPKSLVVGNLESILCLQTVMCFAGHWMSPFAKCLLDWPGRVLFAKHVAKL